MFRKNQEFLCDNSGIGGLKVSRKALLYSSTGHKDLWKILSRVFFFFFVTKSFCFFRNDGQISQYRVNQEVVKAEPSRRSLTC